MNFLNSTALPSAAMLLLLLVTPVPLHHVMTWPYGFMHSQASHYTDAMFNLGKTLSHKEPCWARNYAVGLCGSRSEWIRGAFIPRCKTAIK